MAKSLGISQRQNLGKSSREEMFWGQTSMMSPGDRFWVTISDTDLSKVFLRPTETSILLEADLGEVCMDIDRQEKSFG